MKSNINKVFGEQQTEQGISRKPFKSRQVNNCAMKKVCLLFGLFLLIFMISCKKEAKKGEEVVLTNVVRIDLNEVMEQKKVSEFNQKLYQLALDGKITAYKDDSLLSFYTKEEVSLRGGTTEIIEYVPDPAEPDFWVDSTIVSPFNPKDIACNYVALEYIFDHAKGNFKVRFKSVSPGFKFIFSGIDLGMQPLFLVSLEDLQKNFDKDFVADMVEASLKAMVKTYSYVLPHKEEGISSTFINMSENCGMLTWLLNPKLYESAITGLDAAPVPGYKTDALKDTYTPEEALSLGGVEEIIEYAPDPAFPDDLMDTTIWNPFRFIDSKYHMVCLKWTIDKNKMEAIPAIQAVSLTYLVPPGCILPLFWIKGSDFEKILNETELRCYNYALFYSFATFYLDNKFTYKIGYSDKGVPSCK